MDQDKPKRHHHHHGYEEDKDLEKFMAMSWGSPNGMVSLSIGFAIFLLSIGGFLVLLHLANIIK